MVKKISMCEQSGQEKHPKKLKAGSQRISQAIIQNQWTVIETYKDFKHLETYSKWSSCKHNVKEKPTKETEWWKLKIW